MVSTIPISKDKLNKLPDDVSSLISMGRYTLYRVEISGKPDVAYLLRINATKVFLLKSDGEPVDGEPVDFENLENDKINIKEKIVFNDVFAPIIVRNLSLKS
ncbi:hypothetical protein [Gloeocapsa sp. PCC 73106]|uniref:hypothetical protein n=1 Tax=Gloeocapsa sp. PCC 73106 TaxID=102232 RepID=UPI0002AD03BB|nr:hypothetical protein [Gloeocapsa sp. PCC 73106]ELR98515.1 hypothetical protein GLO73106DRAFT_00023480 [Gloeocapsa sp. PCC 73106]